MSSPTLLHALGLHLYQPMDNLAELLRRDEAETARILHCYERIGRHAHKYAQVARLHVALSPVLLEQLRDPGFIAASRHLADVPAILDSLRGAANIEFIGTGLRHAPLPLIPSADWEEQLTGERLLMEAEMGRALKGYAPPACLFTLEMVPALARAGYEYVLLPASTLALADGDQADPYRAYRLCHQGTCLTAVPWDLGFSHSQEQGMDAPWFADETRNGVAHAPASAVPYLLTTWSDGENGDWFRNPDENQGFFGHFFSPYMEFRETGEFPVRPVLLADYLAEYPATTEAVLGGGESDLAMGLTMDSAQRQLRDHLSRVSSRYWSLARAAEPRQAGMGERLQAARALVLSAEESGYLLGPADRVAKSVSLLKRAEGLMEPVPEKAREKTPEKPKEKAAEKPVKATPPAKEEPARPTSAPPKLASKATEKPAAPPAAEPTPKVAEPPAPSATQPAPKPAEPPAPTATAKAKPAAKAGTGKAGKSGAGKKSPAKKTGKRRA